MSTKFCQLSNLPPLPPEIIAEGLADGYEYTTSPFACAKLATLFRKTDFYNLSKNYFGDVGCKYLKNPPNSYYEWHVDKKRNCALNWIIKTNPDARTFYRNNNQSKFFWELEEVVYNAEFPTLLDTKQEHCVFNNCPEERTILSMSIFSDHSYADVLAFLQSLDIKKY